MSWTQRTIPLPHLPVHRLLSDRGPSTAIEVRQALGISHEDVYAALAHLDATGAAEMRIDRSGAPQGRVWVAA